MSPLTKVFVVLHVVLSIMLAAAVIVFVNRVDDARALYKETDRKLATAENARTRLEAEIQTANATRARAIDEMNNQVAAVRQQLNTAVQQLLDVRGQLATANAEKANLEATLRSAQAAQQVAQENQGRLQTALLETRNSMDKVQQQLTEANLALSDLTNRNQVLQRTVRNLNEELVAAKEDAERGGAAPAGTGAGEADIDGSAVVATNTQRRLNGVVRATQTINGIKYATISLGSADAVAPKMQFRVLGGAGGQEFLGYVTITSVEPHEAVGRVSGPRVKEVTENQQVVTRF